MRRLITVCALSAVSVLTACTGSAGIEDAQAWMNEEKNKARPLIKPLPAPAPYHAVDYVAPPGVEPFNVARLVQALSAENSNSNNSVLYKSIVEGHRKQPLEAYALESISYVGMMNKNNQSLALVKVDNLLYQVRLGEFMGQNFGRVMSIDETQITLREVAQDATGEWVERNATLNLLEGSK